uniref:Uncharacterized protein n=1 Tax=Romanomermis culicivorax TaxID=13658 RepID=A0A915JL58_ROMCU
MLKAIYASLFRRNGAECNRRNVSEGNRSFGSVLDVTVGCFPPNCTYPFRPKFKKNKHLSKASKLDFL